MRVLWIPWRRFRELPRPVSQRRNTRKTTIPTRIAAEQTRMSRAPPDVRSGGRYSWGTSRPVTRRTPFGLMSPPSARTPPIVKITARPHGMGTFISANDRGQPSGKPGGFNL